MSNLVIISVLAGVGTLLLCLLGSYLFKKFGNPFDSLSEEDLAEIEEMKKTLIDASGNLK